MFSGVLRQNLVQIGRRLTAIHSGASITTRSMSAAVDKYNYETLKVTSPKEYVYQVDLNRPDKLNAMNKLFWVEIKECFDAIGKDEDCRSVVLAAQGRVFTAGLDLMDFASVINAEDSDVGRKMFKLRKTVREMQGSFTSIESCPKPVIAAIHNACIGGGVDMTSACDVRYCTNDAFIQIKEVDLGLAADVGTLQRFPKVIGNDSLARELCYTARRMYAAEALQCGFVSRVFDTKEAMLASAIDTASQIAERSPIAVQGTKVNLIYARDHSVPESLEYMVTWNSGMLQSEDVMKAAMAYMEKKTAKFSKL